MLDSLKHAAQRVHASATDSLSDQPDERNAGISQKESALAFVTAIAATFVAREILEASWRRTLDRDPPKNTASYTVSWKEALIWGAVSGAIVGTARIASRRASTEVYRKLS
tara:strand:+ start:109238 stop:109570 length:333 start_codon:yes stop_codon:yes gene_type:complete